MRYSLRWLLVALTAATMTSALVGYWHQCEGVEFAVGASVGLVAVAIAAGFNAGALSPNRKLSPGRSVAQLLALVVAGGLLGGTVGMVIDAVGSTARYVDNLDPPTQLGLVYLLVAGASAGAVHIIRQINCRRTAEG